MCTGKIRYAARVSAERFATQTGARAYECPHCAGWHLTSQGAACTELPVIPVPPISSTVHRGRAYRLAQRRKHHR